MFNLLVMIVLVQPVPVEFTAMSFNIRYDNPGDGASAWSHRIEWVADEMRQVDLIGIQEALRHQVEQLAEQLSEYTWVGGGRNDGKEDGEFVPIFFRTAMFELLGTTMFWLSETPEKPGSRGWDAVLPRVVTSAHLKVRGTEFVFHVMNTHFDHRGIEARLQSAKLLAERIREFSEPVLFLGDLNATSDTDIIETLTGEGSLKDSRIVSKMPPRGPIGTFSGFLENNDLDEAPRIDYILVSPEWKISSYEAVISVQNGRYVSDHLPFKVKLEINEY